MRLRSVLLAPLIGQAMIEVTARGSAFKNGDRLHTGKILRFSSAYEQRQIKGE